MLTNLDAPISAFLVVVVVDSEFIYSEVWILWIPWDQSYSYGTEDKCSLVQQIHV